MLLIVEKSSLETATIVWGTGKGLKVSSLIMYLFEFEKTHLVMMIENLGWKFSTAELKVNLVNILKEKSYSFPIKLSFL